MIENEIAIKVSNLSKCYQIYTQPHDRLKQSIYPRFQRLFRKPSKQYYREFWALNDVSFEVKRGETVGIIGRNGSGKSTLLQMICGTLNPTSGSIKTNGRIAALLELGSGFNPEFTGTENVYMNAAVLGLSKAETDACFDGITTFADIGEFISQPVKTYSSGMLLRLAFAVIAHVNADILVIDEALSVGDAFFNQKCMRFLREFMKTGTILFVSHDSGAVVNFCKKGVLLDHGVLAMQGHPKEVTEYYLKKLYETTQEVGAVVENIVVDEASKMPSDYRDMREDLINNSKLRNDIEVFRFKVNDSSNFGDGGATITSVHLMDTNGTSMSWIVGGEDISLEIRCKANQNLYNPIVGFLLKDRLGQVIFGDNTHLAFQFNAPCVEVGEEFVARFDFRMPVLLSGDYSISPAVASGSQEKHVQHHWVNDALIIRAHASSICFGLVSIPMRKISLQIID